MMTAQLQMKRMLDGLMGTGRNGEDTSEKLSFSSPRVCKCYLLKCCPHDILSATRCDLGQCPRVHNVALRADYELALKTQDYEFQPEVLQTLRNFLAESERRAKVAKKRLKLTQEVVNDEGTIKLEMVKIINEKINAALTKAEEVGASGDVEETLKLTQTIEELKKEKSDAELEYQNAMHTSMLQQQKLRVCNTCCSYLGLEDHDRRLADHFNGRMHLGFQFIRNKVEELENEIQNKYIKKFLDQEFDKKKVEKEKCPSPIFEPPAAPSLPTMERSPSPTSKSKHRSRSPSPRSRHRSSSPSSRSRHRSSSPSSKSRHRSRSHRHKSHRSHSRSYHRRRHRRSSDERYHSSSQDKESSEPNQKKSSSQDGSNPIPPASDIPLPASESKA